MTSEQDHTPSGRSEPSVDPSLARPGAITYLHIPAADVRQAAAFYRDVFGWHINNPDRDRPSFDDPSGHLSGAWTRDHPIASEPGLLPYIYTDDVNQTAARIMDHGGEIVTDPFPEGLLTVATFRDPAGNLLGLWHDTASSGSAVPVATSIQPELWVERASAAVAFYQSAFGATVMHQVGAGDDIVAQLSVAGAAFWVTAADPSMRRSSPLAIDSATGRTLLVVEDPEHVLQQAVDSGATEISPVCDEHGWRLGRIVDPFGHEWEIGRPLASWPPG